MRYGLLLSVTAYGVTLQDVVRYSNQALVQTSLGNPEVYNHHIEAGGHHTDVCILAPTVEWIQIGPTYVKAKNENI